MRLIVKNGFVKTFQRFNHVQPEPVILPKMGGFQSCSSIGKCLSSLLEKSLPPESRVWEARRLQAILLVGGILNPSSDIASQASFLGSHLVQVYAQLGMLEEALLIFERFCCRHNIAYNAIMRAYVDASQFSQAISFFHHSVSELRFVPDNYSWPLVLKACSGLCSLDEGRRVHNLIQSAENHHCFKSNVYTKCALIDMFAKCRSLDEARKVFDDMLWKERDLASWTAIICGTVHQGKWHKALSLFRMMRAEGVHPDSIVIAAVLPACGRSEARQVGMSLQGCAIKSGFHHDVVVSNAVMDMYSKLGDIHQAHGVFHRMLYKDIVSWSTLIAGYSQNCQHHKSIELYLEMINTSVEPSAVVVSTVLHALGKLNLFSQGAAMHSSVLKQGFDLDVTVGCALMDMYSNCGLTGEMDILFSIWSDRDIMIWNSAITAHATCGNFDLALNIFRDIWKTGLEPNSITLMTVLPICTKLGALKQGMEVHCLVIKNSPGIAVSVSNSLIDMYCKCGSLGYGLKVFGRMMEKDIISYNTMISAYGFHGFGKQALMLLDEMKSLGMRPTKTTFVGLLSACSHAGFVQEGWSLYTSMINDYSIMPGMEHYSCMVDLLGRAGHIDDACDFIRKMPDEPDGNVLGCLLSACQIHNKMESMDVRTQEVLRLKLEDTGHHILLSNMYSSTKRWKDASRVRALIKEKGLRKKRGESWIQTGRRTHVFDARDTTHQEFNKIQDMLEILLLDMKEFYAVNPCLATPSL